MTHGPQINTTAPQFQQTLYLRIYAPECFEPSFFLGTLIIKTNAAASKTHLLVSESYELFYHRHGKLSIPYGAKHTYASLSPSLTQIAFQENGELLPGPEAFSTQVSFQWEGRQIDIEKSFLEEEDKENDPNLLARLSNFTGNHVR